MSLLQNIGLLSLNIDSDKYSTYNNYIIDNKNLPSVSSFSNNKILILNGILNKTNLKRACCSRKNSNTDSTYIDVSWLDEYNNPINVKTEIKNLNTLCNNLEYKGVDGLIKYGSFNGMNDKSE